MKKFSKILCAVLVIAVLCSSLIFMVGAEDAAPDLGYTSVITKDGAEILQAIKYDAEDNLLDGVSPSSASSGGWSSDEARQSYIITNTDTGDVYLKETSKGHLAADNEYVNYTFKSVDLLYEAGYSQYVIAEYDMTYESLVGTHINKGETKKSENLKSQMIVRGSSAGTSWGNANIMYFKDYANADKFVHITAVYDFTSGNEYVFVDGVLVATLGQGAFNDAVKAKYLEGETGITVKEIRVGSNSCDTIHLDNMYVRYEKNANDADTLAAAIASGKLTDWSNNIFDSSYKMPATYWYVQPEFWSSEELTVLEDYGYVGSVKNGESVIDTSVEGNLVTSVSRASASSAELLNLGLPANGAYFNTYRVEKNGTGNPYYYLIANQSFSMEYAAGNKLNDKNGDGAADNDNNPFLSAGMTNVTFPVGADSKAMFIFEVDLASNSEIFQHLTIDLEFRRSSDNGGFPFCKTGYISEFTDISDEWVRFTIVGDVAANKAYVFVNGELVKTIKAYDDGQLSGSPSLIAKSARINISENGAIPNVVKGQSVAIDNISERFLLDGDADLSAALAAGSLKDWAGYNAGRSGEKLAEIKLTPIATVNGVEYSDEASLEAALASNDQLDVEFICVPATPVVIKSNAKINTNRMDSSLLFTLGNDVEITKTEGKYVYTKAPHIASVNATLIGDGSSSTSFPQLKDTTVAGNIVSSAGEGNPGSFLYYLVNNAGGGDPYYMIQPKLSTTPGNTFVNVGVNASAITATSYTILDIDVATQTDYVASNDAKLKGITLNLINRSNMLLPGGNYQTPGDGTGVEISNYGEFGTQWTHITVVADFEDNVQHVFVNGQYAGTAGYANERGNSNPGETTADHIAAGNFNVTSLRINISPNVPVDITDTLLIDNVSIRTFADNDAAGDIEACITAGSLAGYANAVTGRGGEELPVLATVDGKNYTNTTALSSALYSNDKLEVEFHYEPVVPATITANAVIDTNGMDINKLVTLAEGCKVVSTDGEYVTISCPFLQNVKYESVGPLAANTTSAYVNRIKASFISGNIFGSTQFVSEQGFWNVDGGRAFEFVTNPATGDTFFHEFATNGEIAHGPANDNGYISDDKKGFDNEYLNHKASPDFKFKYQAGMNEYLVIDMDYTYTNISGHMYFQIVPRNNGSGRWGTNINLSKIAEYFTAGEVIHLTLVADYTGGNAFVFVNGDLAFEVNDGAVNAAGHKEYLGGAELSFSELKIGSNGNDSLYYTNVGIRHFYNDETNDTLAAAITSKDITVWSDSVYTDSYSVPQLPTVAIVDGVEYKSVSALEAALFGNVSAPKNVEFLHVPNESVHVSCDAIINTHGMDIDLTYYGGDLTEKDGLIHFDCDYISDVKYENISDVKSVVNVDSADNKINHIYTTGYNGVTEVEGVEKTQVKTWVAADSNKTYDYAIMAPAMGTVASSPNTYIQLNTANYNFKATDDTYFVVDFDFAYEGDEMVVYGYMLVRDTEKDDTSWFQSGSGEIPARYVTIAKETVGKGQFVHVTLVGHAATNTLYAFANNTLVGTMPMVKEEKFAAATDSTQLYVQGLRISNINADMDDTNAWMLDNTLVRYMPVADAGNLADAIAAESLSTWTGAQYSDSYTMPEMPVIGTVDGAPCHSASDIENAVKAEGHHNVELTAKFYGEITVDGDATINTNKLTDKVSAVKTGAYKFDIGEDWIGDNGIVTASGKYIVKVSKGVYEIVTINKDNWSGNAVVVTWYKTPGDFETNLEDIVYIYGDQIVAPNVGGSFIENGKFVAPDWFNYDDPDQNIIANFPVAGAEMGDYVSYCAVAGQYDPDAEDCEFAAKDILVNMNVNTGFVVKLYVNADQTITLGDYVEIDGVKYLVLTKSLTAYQLASTVKFEFQVIDAEGNVYVQYQTVDVVGGYLAGLLAKEETALEDKNLVMAALAYANEAYALTNGAKNDAITAVLETYAEYAPEAAVLDVYTYTDDIKQYVRSAALYLDETPKFVFKFAMGYYGDVKFSYVDIDNNEVVNTVFVDTTAGEQLVVIDGIGVYDFATSINIELLAIEPEYAWMASPNNNYSLADYAMGLGEENNAFAVALLTYANLANSHKLAELDSKTVAKVNGVRYDSLEAALAEADEYAYVVLFRDVTLETPITLDKSITLDLNGHTVTAPAYDNAIIVDMNDDLAADYGEDYTIDVDIYGADSTVNGGASAILVLDGNLHIYGGYYAADRTVVIVSGTRANVTIESGIFYAPLSVAVSEGTATINGGEFNAAYASEGATLNVDGGTFTEVAADSANVAVTGGTYAINPEAFVASGYKVVENDDGTYSIALDALAYIGTGLDWWGDVTTVTVYYLGTSIIVVDEYGNEETAIIEESEGQYMLYDTWYSPIGTITFDEEANPVSINFYGTDYTLALSGEGGGDEPEVTPEYYGSYSVTTTDTYCYIDLYEMTALVSGTYYFTVPAGLGVYNKAAYDAYQAPEVDFYDNEMGATFEVYLAEGEVFEYYVGALTKGDWIIEVAVVPGEDIGGDEPGDEPVVYNKDANGLGGVYSFSFVGIGFELTFTPDYEGAPSGTLAVVDGNNSANNKTYVYVIMDGMYTFYLDDEVTSEVMVGCDGMNWTFQNYSLRMPQPFAEYVAPEGAETPTEELVLGNTSINASNVNFTYTATEAGTLNLSAGAAIMGMVEMTYSVNGGEAQVLELSTSVELALEAGDTVLITVVAEGYSSITAAFTAAEAGLNYVVVDKSAITSETLTSIDESKIKQMDQATADDGTVNGNANGYFTKEGGSAVYINIEKDGALVEALYFSRNVAWGFVEGTYSRDKENAGYAEHRYKLDSSKKVVSISFDYILNGTCGEHETSGASVFQLKDASGAYINALTGGVFKNTGTWEEFTWTASEPTELANILIKLYAFQGEFVISNLVINYAE